MRDNEAYINTTIHDRVHIGNRAYFANSSLLRSKLISYNTKMKIYKTFIRLVVAYGRDITKKETRNAEV